MQYSVLLVEDDAQIREIITDSFMEKSSDTIKITTADNGEIGLELAESAQFDLIILDVMLPGIDGFSIMRAIRKRSDVPVIILTARTREEDILYGYELGCDDYVTKPFSTATLYAKVLALINRDKRTVTSHVISCGVISVDTRALSVSVSGEEIALPPVEYRLLMCLLQNKGWVVDRERLLNTVWGQDYYGGTRVVDNHIKKLRQLLKEGGKQIKTVISQGYKITD
jgi:DNA-binding response OmpR family regulator